MFLSQPVLEGGENGRCNIVFAAPDQLDWALQYMPKRPLLTDTTFGTNKLGYSLLTALVIDDHGCGLPVVWAIIRSENEQEFEHSFSAFKNAMHSKSAESDPGTLMTDCSNAEKNGLRYDTLRGYEN